MRVNGAAIGLIAVAVLVLHAPLRGDEGASAARAGGEGPPAVTDPVYVGWDRGCVVYRLSAAEGKWLSWRGPRGFLSRTMIAAVGPHAAAALSPADGYGGWVFDLHAEKWAVVPKSPIAPPRGVMDPIAAVFVGQKLVVWGADDGDVQGAALDLATMTWKPIAPAPVAPRYRCVSGAAGSKVLVWGGFGQTVGGHVDALADGAVYDASNDTWATMPAPPVEWLRPACGVVSEGRVVVIGRPAGSASSRTGMVYHLDSGTWDTMAAAPFDVGAGAACAAGRDRVVVWSGGRNDGVPGASADGAVYDFWTRGWTKLPEAPVPGRMLSFGRMEGKGFTVWGGWIERGGVRFFMDGARYDFEKRAWEGIAALAGDVPVEMHPGW